MFEDKEVNMPFREKIDINITMDEIGDVLPVIDEGEDTLDVVKEVHLSLKKLHLALGILILLVTCPG